MIFLSIVLYPYAPLAAINFVRNNMILNGQSKLSNDAAKTWPSSQATQNRLVLFERF